jgi:hypothetical protein
MVTRAPGRLARFAGSARLQSGHGPAACLYFYRMVSQEIARPPAPRAVGLATLVRVPCSMHQDPIGLTGRLHRRPDRTGSRLRPREVTRPSGSHAEARPEQARSCPCSHPSRPVGAVESAPADRSLDEPRSFTERGRVAQLLGCPLLTGAVRGRQVHHPLAVDVHDEASEGRPEPQVAGLQEVAGPAGVVGQCTRGH